MQARDAPASAGPKARALLAKTRLSRIGTAAPPGALERGRLWPWRWSLLFLTIALAAAVRITTLSFQSLWLDEIGTVVEAGRPWPSLFLALFDPQQGYPLYTLGMRLWSSLFGTGEVALRLPSAIAGICTVPLLYLLGRRLFGWKVGMLAAVFLALSPLAIWYSQEARAYAIMMLLTVAAWLLLWEALHRPTRSLWWALGVVTLLSLCTHRLIAVLSLVGQLVYILYVARQGQFTRRYRYLLVVLLVIILAGTVAGLWFVLGGEGARQFSASRDWLDLADAFSKFSLRIHPRTPELGQGPDRRPWLAAFALAALAGTAALIEDVVARGGRRRRAVFLACFLFVPLGTFFLLYLMRPFYYERYLLGSLPAYLLLLTVGCMALWHWAVRLGRTLPRPRKGHPLQVLAALFLGIVAVATTLVPLGVSWQQVQDWTLSRLPQKEQFREATMYLQQHLHPGDLLIVHPDYIDQAVRFYQSRFPRVPLEIHTIRDLNTAEYGRREFEADMDALTRGRRRAWLYLAPYHAPFKDPKNWVYEWFNLNPFLHCDEQHFNGITLYCVSFNEERRQGVFSPTLALNAPFGNEILLFGGDIQPFQQPLQSGDTLPVTLYLQGLHRNLPDIEAVVRLVGPEGRSVWAEEFRQPLNGFLPTSRWLPGDQFMDYHELLLPAGIPAGPYAVVVGFRRVDTPTEMLSLPSGSNWANLGTVEVAAPRGSP
jgi:mannosyltransferase